MERKQIQEFLAKQIDSDFLYAIRFRNYSNAVGHFDKKEMIENSSNVWKFYLNKDPANKKFETDVIEINGDDILTLDAF